jgi:hypothetical protein
MAAFRSLGVMAILAASLAVPSAAVAATPDSIVYRAGAHFRTSPNEANPSGPWSYRQAIGSRRPLLDEFWTDQAFYPGLETWHGQQISMDERDKLPFVGVNTSGSDAHPFNIDWPAGALLVHPSSTSAVVVRWRSPGPGTIRIRASVIDRDNNCGDGVSWSIRLRDQQLVAKGAFPNGGSAGVRSGPYRVDAGSLLELRVGMGAGGNHGCDSTQVGLRITLTPD